MLGALVYGITSGEGILKVVGEVGSVVVFIEEAQSMPLETLEEVRLLSNLEPLSIEETRAYLHFRLHSAGEIQPMILPRHVKVAIADSAYKSMGSYAGGERRLPAWLGYPVAALVGALALWAVLGWQRGSDPAVMPVYSVAASEGAQLEEFLEFLSLSGLLEQTWLCRISANSERPEQWLVLHGEFPGVSDSRRFIEGLPTFVRQRGPYVRNLDGIACANAGA